MNLNLRQKNRLFVMFIMLVLPIVLTLGWSQDLKTGYRSGSIVLNNSPGFGEATDWKLQFYNTFTDITAAADGSIFAASNRQHTIFKFDSKGALIKSFGQEGQGPGDFNGPGDLSILDGKYLVVGEYALGHRISLFDLAGWIKVNRIYFGEKARCSDKIDRSSLQGHRTEQYETRCRASTGNTAEPHKGTGEGLFRSSL